METTKNTHNVHFIHREIPPYNDKEGICDNYLMPPYVTPEAAALEIRSSLRYYAPGTVYIIFQADGTEEEPLYLQPLNMQSLNSPERGPGLRKPLSEAHQSMVESVRFFWKHAKMIQPGTPLL